MATPVGDYGSGQSLEVIVDQSGPDAPPQDMVEAAHIILSSRRPAELPPACMDCRPNLILRDGFCPMHGWEWEMLVAHDDTCPALAGVVKDTGVRE